VKHQSYLEKLSSSTKSIHALLVEGIIVKLNKILPTHILELVGVLVQSQATQPAGDIAQQLEISRILRRLRAAASTTRRPATSFRVVRKVTLVTTHAEVAHAESIHVCIQHASIIGGKETIVLSHGEVVHVGARRARDGDSRRAGTRAASLESSELLGLKSSSLLRTQDLAKFVGHEDVHVLLLLVLELRLTLRRACSAELLDIIKLDTVVDSGESGELHGSGVCNHVSMSSALLLGVEVGHHGSVNHGSPAVVGVVWRKNVHSRILVGGRDGGVLQVGIARQLEGSRGTQGLSELAHGLLALRRARSGNGLVLVAAVVPGRGREWHRGIFLVVEEKGRAVTNTARGGSVAGVLLEVGLLFGNGSGGIREERVDGAGVESRVALSSRRWWRLAAKAKG